ncbi:MAG: DUF302 domain-containing protein [Spirochaetota bacterium]
MSYYIEKIIESSLSEAESRIREALSAEGFGIVMELNIQETLREKTGTDIGPYKILGACNPNFAKQAIAVEPQIGTMLPCNVTLRHLEDGKVEVASIDPVASMQAVQNGDLAALASEVRDRLKRAVESI